MKSILSISSAQGEDKIELNNSLLRIALRINPSSKLTNKTDAGIIFVLGSKLVKTYSHLLDISRVCQQYMKNNEKRAVSIE